MILKLIGLTGLILLPIFGHAQSYFQQEVNYKIAVALNDKEHILRGTEEIEYFNSSPDTLTFIYFHLWPNAYKNKFTAMAKQLREDGDLKFHYADVSDRGFIDSLNFHVNGTIAKWELDAEFIDICKVHLNEPLLPGGKITISTPFRVKIPLGVYSRLGHLGETYQITQWYPKPAVYDREGWHQMPYLTMGEFYSEFGAFDVSITLPKNYVVGATGDLVNGAEELAWLEEKAKETESRKEFPASEPVPTSSSEYKTLRFQQKNVHDFAWFADKQFYVLKGEVELPHTKRKVATWAMFTAKYSPYWMKSIEYLNDATYYYSLWNGDYPYNHVTAVDGALSAGGGMEYPNITVIGSVRSDLGLEDVIMHEVGHNWFYGILGSNERDHAWMDEGINSFNESRYIETKYPERTWLGLNNVPIANKLFRTSQYQHKQGYKQTYLFNASRNLDQPLELTSSDYTSINYGTMVYQKSAAVFEYLKAYLGETKFDAAMQRYYREWQFKHPGPDDLRKIFEDETKEDLSWFFTDLIATSKKLDYKLHGTDMRSVLKNDLDSVTVRVKNTGEIVGPFALTAGENRWWFKGSEKQTSVKIPYGDYATIEIDGGRHMPELRSKNNVYKTSGVFRKTEQFRMQLLTGLPDRERSNLYFFPALGWNKYDGVMAGMLFHNQHVFQRTFDWELLPLYSFSTSKLAGLGSAGFTFTPNTGPLHTIRLRASAQRFHERAGSAIEPLYAEHDSQFTKISSLMEMDVRKKKLTSLYSHKFSVRLNNITHNSTISWDPSATSVGDTSFSSSENFLNFNYKFGYSEPLSPVKASVTYIVHKDFQNIQLNAIHHLRYNLRGDRFTTRLFVGKFLFNNTTHPRYNWRMDGQSGNGPAGYLDYQYSEVFLGRSETSGLLSKQFIENHGGFKTPTANGQSNNWIVALNFKTDIPLRIKLPIHLFADLGFSPINIGTSTEIRSISAAGFYLPFFKGLANIYVPVLLSETIQMEHATNAIGFFNRIRFTLSLSSLDVFSILRSVQP